MNGEVIPSRQLNTLYIWFDILFLLFFLTLLIYNKKYTTFIWSLLAGILYFIVDYGIFYLMLGTRTVAGANTFFFLLWLSMSYGITNFAWIWLWMKKDKHLFEWSLLIIAWWIACPLLAQNFGGEPSIFISRGTGSYHGVMAALMFAGYAILCLYNIKQEDKSKKVNILWLLIIGILVQFSWEASLLIGNIRSQENGFKSIITLIQNSLIETNMGMPYVYMLYKLITKRVTEDLKRIPLPQKAANFTETFVPSELLQEQAKEFSVFEDVNPDDEKGIKLIT